MLQAFKTHAEAVSAEVHQFATRREAMDCVLQILAKEGVATAPDSYAVWADCPFLQGFDRSELEKKIPGLKFGVTRELAADAKVGISQMDWAIANTGTLAQASDGVAQRLVSTLPFIHIAIVPTRHIVPDLPGLLSKLSPRESAYLALITGPSRTADIERVLTIGVHGPQRLIIAFVDELT